VAVPVGRPRMEDLDHMSAAGAAAAPGDEQVTIPPDYAAVARCILQAAAAAVHPSHPPTKKSLPLVVENVLYELGEGPSGMKVAPEGSGSAASEDGEDGDEAGKKKEKGGPSKAKGKARGKQQPAEKFPLIPDPVLSAPLNIPALPGRELETIELLCKIMGCMARGETASLYLSGGPGTGKTATVVSRFPGRPYSTLVTLRSPFISSFLLSN
jgi:hypothetical protein